MAILRADLLAAPSNDPNPVTHEGGRLRATYARYTLLGTETIADVIHMCKVPRGALVHSVISESDQIDGSANGATTPTDLTVGDLDSLVRYAANLSPDTAAVLNIYGFGSTIAERPVLVDTAGKETIVVDIVAIDNNVNQAGDVISVAVYYTID